MSHSYRGLYSQLPSLMLGERMTQQAFLLRDSLFLGPPLEPLCGNGEPSKSSLTFDCPGEKEEGKPTPQLVFIPKVSPSYPGF